MWIAVLAATLILVEAGAAWLLPPDDALPVAVGGLVVFLGFVARGMFSVRSSLLVRTHWRSDDSGETRVALTFDDGPHPEWTPAVLDALRVAGVKATFFLIGENVRRWPDLVRRIREEGHELACHGDSHSWATPFWRQRRLAADLRRCLDSVREVAGVTPRFYRPPIGIRAPGHLGVAEANELLVIGMARRGGDARATDPDALARHVVSSARGGEILTLHDGEEPRHPVPRAVTVAALPRILAGLAAKGLEPVPVSSLLSERPYREAPSRGWTGRSRGGRLGAAIFAFTVRRLGRGTAAAIGHLVSAWFVPTHPVARRASIDLRRRLHGRASTPVELWWVYRHFLAYADFMVDRVAFVSGKSKLPDLEIEGYEDVRSVIETPGGVLLLSAHVGDWIAASRRLSDFRDGRETWVVAARGMGIGPHQVRRESAEACYHTIDVEAHPVDVAARIVEALRRGDIVAMLGDRRVSEDSVRLPFLGGEADFPTGPWAVAMATGAPVLVFFVVRHPGGRHVLHIRGPIRVPRGSRDDRRPAIREAAGIYAAHLEEVVRRHPFQWSNFYDFWAAS